LEAQEINKKQNIVFIKKLELCNTCKGLGKKYFYQTQDYVKCNTCSGIGSVPIKQVNNE